jgi:hypothetical protein
MPTTTTHRSMPTIPATTVATHRIHYTRAMMFIADHGHFAAITKDGLLALSWEGNVISPMGEPADDGIGGSTVDAWYEAPMLFEVDEDGMVVSRDVRIWLGY